MILGICMVSTVQGQSCYLQQDCGPGTLCSSEGTCQPIRSLLDTGSNSLFWVDQQRGNDANNGSENLPFRSIARAMQPGTLQPGDALIIREGTYFEPIIPPVGGQPGKLITITAFPGETVVISGATTLSGSWTPDGDAFRLSWPFDALWHRYEGPDDLFGDARRRDVLIADGQMLQAVYTRSDLREGTFFLAGSPDNPSTMYTILPTRKNPNQALMQTSRLNHLFNPSNNEPHCRFGNVKGYFHLIGLTFRHSANDGQLGAVCAGSEGSILEAITVEWTNGSGFLISGKNHIVRGVSALNNGMSGIRGSYCDNCLIEHAASKFNNWKGYKMLWESGGGKWLYTTNSTFRHLDFSDNEGPGLWLDMDNFDNVIEQSRFDHNRGANLFLEWTTNDNIVRNNVFTRARLAETHGNFYGHGLLIHSSNNNLVLHNTFMDNAGGGMRIRADARDRSTGNRYYNNLFIANQEFDPVRLSSEISFEEHRGHGDARSNKGEGNVFWYRSYGTSEQHTFQYRLQGSNPNVRTSTLSAWQNQAHTDYTSWVMDPSRPHVQDTTDHLNGWRLAENSQYIGRAVILPDDLAPVPFDFDGHPRPSTSAAVGADQPFSSENDEDNSNEDQDNSISRVQFLTLLVLKEDNAVGIFWESTNEQDLDSYEVERSQNNEDFESIGVLSKKQTQAAVQSYVYSDNDIPENATRVYYRVKTIYTDRSVTYSTTQEVDLDSASPPTDTPEDEYRIDQNFPNPASSSTRIAYRIPESSHVHIVLYNLLGRKIKTLVDVGKAPGTYIIDLDTSELPGGMYYYQFKAGPVQKTHVLSVIK